MIQAGLHSNSVYLILLCGLSLASPVPTDNFVISSTGTVPSPLPIPGRGTVAPPLYVALPLGPGGPPDGAGAGAEELGA